MTIDELVLAVREFNQVRGWYRKSPEFLLALVTEVGELAECYKWKRLDFTLTASEKKHIADELADVVIYVACMAIADDIDLTEAITSKIAANGTKYPTM